MENLKGTQKGSGRKSYLFPLGNVIRTIEISTSLEIYTVFHRVSPQTPHFLTPAREWEVERIIIYLHRNNHGMGGYRLPEFPKSSYMHIDRQV